MYFIMHGKLLKNAIKLKFRIFKLLIYDIESNSEPKPRRQVSPADWGLLADRLGLFLGWLCFTWVLLILCLIDVFKAFTWVVQWPFQARGKPENI